MSDLKEGLGELSVLPTEIIELLLSTYLEVKDVVSVRSLNRTFRQICSSHVVWSGLAARYLGSSIDGFHAFAAAYSRREFQLGNWLVIQNQDSVLIHTRARHSSVAFLLTPHRLVFGTQLAPRGFAASWDLRFWPPAYQTHNNAQEQLHAAMHADYIDRSSSALLDDNSDNDSTSGYYRGYRRVPLPSRLRLFRFTLRCTTASISGHRQERCLVLEHPRVDRRFLLSESALGWVAVARTGVPAEWDCEEDGATPTTDRPGAMLPIVMPGTVARVGLLHDERVSLSW